MLSLHIGGGKSGQINLNYEHKPSYLIFYILTDEIWDRDWCVCVCVCVSDVSSARLREWMSTEKAVTRVSLSFVQLQ